jgi:hypothetical protein
MPSPLRRSGSGLLQNPWPGILPSPTPSGLGPLVPSRGFVSTRQSSISLRPAALFLLASPPGFRLRPEVDYRAPLAAYPDGTHTRWSRALSGQHWEGKTRYEFTRLSSRRDGDLQGLETIGPVRWSRAKEVGADADPDFGGGDLGAADSLSSLTKWLSLTTMTWSRHSRRRVPTNLSVIALA